MEELFPFNVFVKLMRSMNERVVAICQPACGKIVVPDIRISPENKTQKIQLMAIMSISGTNICDFIIEIVTDSDECSCLQLKSITAVSPHYRISDILNTSSDTSAASQLIMHRIDSC